MDWRKDDILADLAAKKEDGVVDAEIVPLLDSINACPDYYTTSSCAGRVALLAMPKLGDKKNARFAGKWHRSVDWDEFDTVVGAYNGVGELYLVSQSPVVHVACRSINAAIRIRDMGVACGAKYSTLRSLTRSKDGEYKKLIVEILSTENLNMPLAGRGKLFPNEEYLHFLLDTANMALGRARTKFERFRAQVEALSSENAD